MIYCIRKLVRANLQQSVTAYRINRIPPGNPDRNEKARRAREEPMSDALLVRHCSPTLAGMKTGSMFTSPYRTVAEVLAYVREQNRLLVPKGLRLLPLRRSGKKVLLYLYRPDRLSADLARKEAESILRERGYGSVNPASCLGELMRRLRREEAFPHEIGLFLGYPPEDVRGFIEHRSVGCKRVGAWKVYGDPEAAERIFARYRRCTLAYEAQLSRGATVDRLAVAERDYSAPRT